MCVVCEIRGWSHGCDPPRFPFSQTVPGKSVSEEKTGPSAAEFLVASPVFTTSGVGVCYAPVPLTPD